MNPLDLLITKQTRSNQPTILLNFYTLNSSVIDYFSFHSYWRTNKIFVLSLFFFVRGCSVWWKNLLVTNFLWVLHIKRKQCVIWTFSRSIHSQMFFKIRVLKSFAISTGKHLYWSHFLIKLQAFRPATLLQRDSNIGVFLWILRNF